MSDANRNRTPGCISGAFLGVPEPGPQLQPEADNSGEELVEKDPYLATLTAMFGPGRFQSHRYPNRLVEFLEANSVTLQQSPQDYSATLTHMGINRSMVLVMTGRCGSTWLASALKATGVIGEPEEYFADDKLQYYWDFDKPQTFEDVFKGVVERYRCGGNFNFKINPTRLFWLGRLVDIRRTFTNNSVWVDLRRLNLVKQAFSFARAMLSGVWHHRDGNRGQPARELEYAELEPIVLECLAEILRQESNIEIFYRAQGISPLRLFYEDLIDSRRQVLIQIINRIDPTLDALALSSSEGNTSRISKDDDLMELEFVRRHATRINVLRTHRSNMSEVDIYNALYR